MKKIDLGEIYTIFEEIKELILAQSKSYRRIQSEMEQPDLSAIGKLSGKLDIAIEEIRNPFRVEHQHVFSITSNKVFYGMLGLCFICLVFSFIVFRQKKVIANYRDNDLKYRYVQMQGEISPTGVINLDIIFKNRKDSVRVIRKQVEQHEKTVIEKSKQLEQVRLKEQEAEQLKREAESLKYSK